MFERILFSLTDISPIPSETDSNFLRQSITDSLEQRGIHRSIDSVHHLYAFLSPESQPDQIALKFGDHKLTVELETESLMQGDNKLVHLVVARFNDANDVTGDFLTVLATLGKNNLQEEPTLNWVTLANIVPDTNGKMAVQSFIEDPENGTSLSMKRQDATLIFSYSYGDWSLIPVGMTE